VETASERFAAQGLNGSDLVDAGAVVDRLLAVQAQDGRGARLAIRSRLAGSVERPAASMVDAELDAGSLVINWLNRGTLHLVRADDHGWLHGLTAPRLATSNQTRLRQEGVSEAQAERGVELIVERLGNGPATRTELRDLLESAGIPVAGQALMHILFFASIQGLILRGPTAGDEHAFVLVDDWLGRSAPVDPELAAAELARRYLAGHGPATDRDLAKWAGVTLGVARKGLKSIAGELDEAEGMVDLKDRAKAKGVAPVRLLGSFDPVLHGWASREWLIPDEAERQVVTTNGIFRPTILAGNRIVGTWTLTAGKLKLSPFGKLDRKTVAALDLEAERVVSYLSG
jgi:hypothetical protein